MFKNKTKSASILLATLIAILMTTAVCSPTHAQTGSTGGDVALGIATGGLSALGNDNVLTFLGCDDSDGDGLTISDCVSSTGKGPVTSFIDFQGDLKPPNPEGYAAGLTQATDARTYILNVTNFFLGFLGLIAVLIVIYGGVLSVTSMGNPDGVNKGKKAITYAGIGLLIVMGSFALVNTILLAPSGRETATSTGTISSSSIRGVAGNQRFNYLAQQIDEIIIKTYNSYQFHLQAKQQIADARQNILAIDQSKCVVPMGNCVNDFRNKVQAQLNTLSNLTQSANAQFNTGMSQFLADLTTVTNTELAAVSDKITENDCNTSNAFAEPLTNKIGGIKDGVCYPKDQDNIRTMFNVVRDKIAQEMLKADVFLKASYAEDINASYNRTAGVFQVVSGLASELIGQQHFLALIPERVNPPHTPPEKPAVTSKGLFAAEYKNMETYLAIEKSLAGIEQKHIQNALKSLVEIKSVLLNIKFVDTIISADSVKGNAPLIVNFSSVGSSDPSGFTITDDRIEWDLNGDGKFSGEGGGFNGDDKTAGLMSCPEANKATASCIFTKAGTYRVTLRIKPKADGDKNPATGLNWNEEIAPGVSYIDILVNPPATKINLEVGPKAGPSRPVIKYNDSLGTIEEDRDKVYFTLAEARAGLKFDATKSTFSDGTTPITNDPTSKIRWNFGVASENNDTFQIPAANTLSLEQAYPAIGNYQVRFEVTDKNGVVDRKIFTVVVSNLAPRITNPPTRGKINEEITFDGSNSTSDGGPIIFNWKIQKLGPSLTAFADQQPLWLKPLTAHAAVIDFSQVFSANKPSLTGASAVLVPIKTIEPFKRTEKNEFYECKMPEGKDDTLACTFYKAGNYRVTLSLDDEGVPREESTDIIISSNAPAASFKPTKISASAPALYKLDAVNYSFDQDEQSNAGMEYSWEINPDKCTIIGFADQNTDFDLLAASSNAYSTQTPCSKLKDFNSQLGMPVVKFTEKGTYAVNLAVRMSDEPELISGSYEQSLNIDSVLDVAWGEMKPSAVLAVPGDTKTSADQLPNAVNPNPVAPVTFLFTSSQGIAYELEFGDSILESGEMTPGTMTQVTHNYSATGKYQAELRVFDADDVENTISRKIFIGNSDSPIAIITTLVNGSEVEPTTIELENNGSISNAIRVNRKDTITFDAEKAVNTDGSGRRLTYSWNINNNEKQSTNRQVAHNFRSVSVNGEPYVIKLKVSNERDATQTGEDEVNILVVGEQPVLRSLTGVPTNADLTTPVNVKLTAVGASDPDGQIVQYKWWYYDANKPATPEERLGIQITAVPTATLAIGTRGLEGEKPKYKFGVELTDNDNLVVSTDHKDENKRLLLTAPEVQVTNGPNKAPIARFTVDRTSVHIGESVNFTSSSIDPDAGGRITEYKWDFGDGTRGENRANVSHVYQKANVDGYRAKLTVVDNNFSEATSDILRIYVDAEAAPPVAGFTTSQQGGSKTIKFANTSTADAAAGASISKYSWDFDVNYDSNGDGIKDNDIDSGEKEPSYTYPNFGIFRAKLTVEDNQGQTRSVTNFVNVKPAEAVVTAGLMGGDGGDILDQADLSNSANKTLAANVFEAGNQIDPTLLIFSISAYAILLLSSRKKKKKESIVKQ